MLNFLWLFMILAGIVYAAFTGNLQAVTDAALDSAQQAVAICITMAGVLAFWVGLMQIAENAGMMRRAAERIYPLLHFLFPRVPKDHPACKSIAANCIANFFGLGWAATPAGLQAMEDLDELEKERTLMQAVGQSAQSRYDFGSDRILREQRKNSFHRNVYVSGAEYFFSSTDPCNGHCLSKSVWFAGSGRDYRSSDRCYDNFLNGRDFVRKNYVCNR